MMWHILASYLTIFGDDACGGSAVGPIDTSTLPNACASTNELQAILKIVFGVVGALALLMITVSGFRYITSAGDPQQATQAKNGLIYSLVGLAVALTAEAIVAFVVGNL